MSAAASLEVHGPEAVRNAEDFARVSGASPAVVADLDRYRLLMGEWNENMNLVGPATMDVFWSRHAWDSAQLLKFAPEALTWADLGAGAGLPGVVLAIMGKDRPGFHVHLIDSLTKRCRFLQVMVDELALPATVHNARAESLDIPVDVVTARACAPLPRLLGYAQPYFRRGAVGWFLKGQDVASELKEATTSWTFKAEVLPSLSDSRGRILSVRSVSRGRSV